MRYTLRGHGNTSLKWLVDLDRLCWRGTIDWPKIQGKAELLRGEKALRFSLSAGSSFFDTPVDPFFDPAPQTRWHSSPYFPDVQSWSEGLFLLRLLRTPAQKLRNLAIRLLISTAADCKFLPPPSSLFYLYYPLRPLRLVGRL